MDYLKQRLHYLVGERTVENMFTCVSHVAEVTGLALGFAKPEKSLVVGNVVELLFLAGVDHVQDT